MIKLLYAAFLGLILALFVGYGVSVFYSGPEVPEYPTGLDSTYSDCDSKTDGTTVCTSTTTIEQKAIQEKYEKDYEAYIELEANYNRNVALVLVGFSVVLLGLGIWMDKKLPAIGDGFLLGGAFTLFYGVIMAMSTENSEFGFAIMASGVLISVLLGYWKFVMPTKKSTKKAK